LTPARNGGSSLSWKDTGLVRVIAYVDGYNLYHGLREKKWQWAYWLNIQALAKRLLKSNQILTQTKYFTSIVTHAQSRQRRQMTFLEALQTLSDFQIFYGHFLTDSVTCKNCGHTYMTFHEKMTDVNISVEMMTDAFKDQFDMALLISADSDLVNLVKNVQRVFKKKVIVAFPPKRSSAELKRFCNGYTYIGRNVLYQSLFPDTVVKTDGFALKRPAKWH
jgi:uncharacterized LabA/DUF88 family protein